MRKLMSIFLVLALAVSTFAVKDLLSDRKTDPATKKTGSEIAPPLSSSAVPAVIPPTLTRLEQERAAAAILENQLPSIIRAATTEPTTPPLAPPRKYNPTAEPTAKYYSSAVAEISALKESSLPVPRELYDRAARHHGIHSEDHPLLERQGGDTIAEAVAVPLDTTVTGTTIGYNDDYDETCPYTGSTSPDVVYLLTLEEDTGVSLDLCDSGYDTKVYVYDSDLNLVDCNDDACPDWRSDLLLELIPAGDYYIVIDGYGGDSGDYILHILEFSCDPLECEGTEEIEDNGGCNADTPVFQEITVGETICGTTWVDGGDWDEDWFVFDLPEFYEVTLLVESYNFDPIFYIISDPNENCLGGTLAIVNNGVFCETEIYSDILGPGHYYVWIKEYDTTTDLIDAEFSLTLTGEIFTPPQGDFCADPLVIDALPFSTTGTTTDNTDTYGNQSPDEWYALEIVESGNTLITHCGGGTDYDSYLRLLSNDCATEIAYNDDSCGLQSELSLFLVPGDYVVCVEGYWDYSGNYSLDVTHEPFEPGQGDFCGDPWVVEELPYATTGTTTDNIDTYGWDVPDEWYQVEIDHEGLYTFSLCGSSFNTYLYLLAEDCISLLAVNDNDCDLQSRITAQLNPGIYNICIEGYWNEMGDYELEITEILCEPLGCEGTPEDEDNGGCYAMTPVFQPIAPGETICGELWATTMERDSDWFVFDLDDFYLATIQVESYFCDPYLYLISDPQENCFYSIITSTNNGTICEEEELIAILGPGHYYAFVMHDNYEQIEGEYALTLTTETYVPPPGDFCEEPLLIEEFPFTVVGITNDNSNTYGNPAPDEWYEFTLEESGNFYATLCASETDYDTYLRLMLDDCATELAVGDIGPLCEEDQAPYEPSEVMSYLEAGTYKLCVEGYSNNMGTYRLTATFDQFTPGTGDFCDDPHIVPELPFEITASNLNNIDTYGNPSPDEWYSFEILEEGVVTISLCEGTTFNSYIYLLADDCSTLLFTDDYGCGGWGSPSYIMRLMQPGTYLLCVEAVWGVNGGDYTLSIEWEEFDPPPGEFCESAIQIQFLPFEVVDSTTDNFDTYGNPSPDEWYQFSLPVEGNVLISLCDGGTNYDSYLRLLSEDCLSEIVSNDDACGLQSELDVFLSSGTYRICVEGYWDSAGAYSLDVTTDAPSQGDNCFDPFIIEEFPFSDEWFTFGYSDNGFEPSADVFYEFLLEDEGIYTFTTCMEETYEGYFDTRLLILAEDCETIIYINDDDCAGAYDNWSTITTCLAQGLYYLVIEGYGMESGNYQLACSYVDECDPCEPPDCPNWGIDEVEPNNGSNGNPPAYDSIAPGETHCGGVWSSTYTRDSDWYQFEVAADTEVEFFLDGEEGHALVLYLIDESSGSPEIVVTGNIQGYCSDYSFTHVIEAAGLYSVYVAYDDFYAAGPSSLYTLTWGDPFTVGDQAEVPHRFDLAQNYPNPFNPTTIIEFTLPYPEEIRLEVYNLLGQQVMLLAEGSHSAGAHQVQFDGSGLASGIYLYRLEGDGKVQTRKMAFIR